MSGILTALLVVVLAAVYVVKDEILARRRRKFLLTHDPLGQRLKEPAYLRKTFPSGRLAE